MLDDRQMLQYIYQNAEMGRDGISHVLPFVKDAKLAQALTEQQEEYRASCSEAERLLQDKGEEADGSGLMAKVMTRVSSDVQALSDPSPSHIAEMMIQGNTMGVTKMVRHLHDFKPTDQRVQSLAKRQLETAQDNIEQMKSFL